MSHLLKLKKYLSFFIFLGIAIFIYNIIDWHFFLNIAKNANIYILLIAILFSFLWPLINSLRWNKILLELGFPTNFFYSFKVIMISFTLNLFAPAKLGDLLRVVSHTEIKDKGKLLTGVIFDRLTDLFILGFLSIFGGIFTSNIFGSAIGVLTIFSLITLFIIIRYIIKFKNQWFIKITRIILESFKFFTKKSKNIFIVMSYSLSNWILTSIQVWLFYNAFGGNISLFIVICFFPITVLLSLLPITPSGLGLREISFIYIFSPYVESHISLAVSLSYFLFNAGLAALMGVMFIDKFVDKDNLNKIKEFIKKNTNFKNIIN